MTSVVPPELPRDAADAARDMLGGASTVAARPGGRFLRPRDRLPDQVGPSLIHASRLDFVEGLQVPAATGAVGAFALAISVAIALPRLRAGVQLSGYAPI